MRESNVEDALVREARKRSVWALKAERLHVGFPDRILLAPSGRFALVELKVPGENLRPAQQIVRGWLKKLGFTVYVVDEVEKVEGFFEKWLS